MSDFVEGSIEHDHVTDADAAFGFVGGKSAVDEEFGDFGDFLFIGFCGKQIARLALDGGAPSGAIRPTRAGLLIQTQGGQLLLIRSEG